MLRALLVITLVELAILDQLLAEETKPHANTLDRDPRAGSMRDDNCLRMKFIWCPPGQFVMGSPKDEITLLFEEDEEQANVELTRGFWIAQTEITQWQWIRLMGQMPWKPQDEDFYKDRLKIGDHYPVVLVSQIKALEYCQALTKAERDAGRLPVTEEYSLPTEAEWERACRAGTNTRFSFGPNANDLTDYAWCYDNAKDSINKNDASAHPVATKKPNPWGIYDMHGNVSEWCLDVYRTKLQGGKDPCANTTDTRYEDPAVVRGGAWTKMACYCAHREDLSSRCPRYDLGFRPVRALVRKAK